MVVCPNCGEENPERARFCLNCGAALEAVGAAGETRKTVTILFSDVTGSTAMGEKLDPETMRNVMSRYFDEMRAVIESHGGTVEKFIGDAVMAVFGVPVLHEDDALRAVRAAAEMRDALERLNVDLDRDRGVTIQTRTGVNTGEVVAGSGNQTMVTGDAVNTAARLEQHAQPGEILLGEPTYRLVRHGVVAEPAEPISAKGKAEPVVAFRLIRPLLATADSGRRLDSPIIGRDNEMLLAEQAFERAIRERSCSLFTVFGSAGVGKSRLTQEVIRSVEARATVSRGRCLPYGSGITFWPLVEIIHDLGGMLETDSDEVALSKIEKLLEGEESASAIAAKVGQLIGVGEGTASPEEMNWAIRRLFESQAQRKPLVVVFDDIHWAEPALLDLIEYVADWSREASILLLCLARPELLDARSSWGGGKLNASSILLEPLDAEESTSLIGNLLGGIDLPAQLVGRIADAAEGNPLFVEEMVNVLIDDGFLRRADHGWELRDDIAAVPVPPTIAALLAARLDRLTATERGVIQAAAVVGKDFWPEAVAAVMDEDARAQTMSVLMTLTRKELIRPDRSQTGPEDSFRFRHMLIRDAAYNAIPKNLRAQQHERFAGWLESHAGPHRQEFDEIIGYHLEEAFRYRAALGPIDDEARALAVRAGSILGVAGSRTYRRGDARGAVNLLGRALALTPDGAPDRAQVLFDLGSGFADVGDFARGITLLEEAERAAAADDNELLEWRARIERLANGLNIDTTRAMSAEVIAAARQALEIFERAHDDAALANAWVVIGNGANMAGDYGLQKEAAERAIGYLDHVDNDQLRFNAYRNLFAALYFGPTPVSEWRSIVDRLKAAASSGFLSTTVLEIHSIAILSIDGQIDEAIGAFAREAERMRSMGQMIVGGMEGFILGPTESALGRFEEADATFRRSIEFFETIGEKGFLSTLLPERADLFIRMGRFDEAYAATVRSEEISAPDDSASQIYWRAARAKVLAHRGETVEADELAREALRIAVESGSPEAIAISYSALTEAARAAGDRAGAQDAKRREIETYEAKEFPIFAERARRELALLQSTVEGES